LAACSALRRLFCPRVDQCSFALDIKQNCSIASFDPLAAPLHCDKCGSMLVDDPSNVRRFGLPPSVPFHMACLIMDGTVFQQHILLQEQEILLVSPMVAQHTATAPVTSGRSAPAGKSALGSVGRSSLVAVVREDFVGKLFLGDLVSVIGVKRLQPLSTRTNSSAVVRKSKH
jgi:hypothetical protein